MKRYIIAVFLILLAMAGVYRLGHEVGSKVVVVERIVEPIVRIEISEECIRQAELNQKNILLMLVEPE